AAPAAPASGALAPRVAAPSIVPQHHAFKTRALNMAAPKVLLIGSSTGGPQALTTVLRGLGAILERVPVLITQHMPPTFTTILAEHTAK
ncbi:chemotaxis protein CheB, partial [Stenotrophomonas maltophilia]|uniref:chemotaxis protein CheB n=1 Tax=Stenotrophomonas maltophilia TaxID=40324 RepID=UPI0023BA952B